MYQTMKTVYSSSRDHNTHLWANVKFSLKRMYNPLCQSSGEQSNPVAEDKDWVKNSLETRREKFPLLYGGRLH